MWQLFLAGSSTNSNHQTQSLGEGSGDPGMELPLAFAHQQRWRQLGAQNSAERTNQPRGSSEITFLMCFVLGFPRFLPRSAAQVHQRWQTLRAPFPAGVPGVGGGLCRGDGHRAPERGGTSCTHCCQPGGQQGGLGAGLALAPLGIVAPHIQRDWDVLGAFPVKAQSAALLACP